MHNFGTNCKDIFANDLITFDGDLGVGKILCKSIINNLTKLMKLLVLLLILFKHIHYKKMKKWHCDFYN